LLSIISKRRRLATASIIIFALIAAGCGQPRISQTPGAPRIPAGKPTPELAQSLLNNGDSVQAAHMYAQLASTETDPARKLQFQLLATELYFDNELYNDGARAFAGLPQTMPSEPLQLRRNIAAAYYALAQRNPQPALESLPDTRTITDPLLKARILEAQARARLQMSDPAQALKARVQLEASLRDPQSIARNHERIWAMLTALDNAGLQALARTPAGPTYRGWVEYALLTRVQMDETTRARRLALWRNRYPNHPASDVTQTGTDPATPFGNIASSSISSGQIALLLPLSGKFSELGTAIKTGFMAAHYADGAIAFVRFYDTQSDPMKAIEQYQLAAAEGASLIIGPLNKSAVVNLTASNQITVPTLSLNYVGEDIPGNSNLYQFGLLPEDEAKDVANFARLADYNNALIIHADSALAQRLAAAFEKRFVETGGTTLGTDVIEADTYDYSRQLGKLLSINSSNARRRQLEQLLDTKIEFEPAIRNDIDVIFMAVDAEQARLLRPQLKFHRAGEVPVLSTAMVYSGAPDEKADSDLTGIRYNEIPWLLTDVPARTTLFQSIAPHQPDDSPGFARLNALGIDAYLLHKELERMRLDPQYSVAGSTGALSLAPGNRIQRRLAWAEFQEGIPVRTSDAIPVEAAAPPMLSPDI
jgi:outer membrane PBP1 activator LpoA protein